MVDRTVIIIAHRLSTVKDADVIAVFGKGSIIDAGRHDDLLCTSKTYANLVRKQLSSAHAMNFSATLTGEVLEEGSIVSDSDDLELGPGGISGEGGHNPVVLLDFGAEGAGQESVEGGRGEHD